MKAINPATGEVIREYEEMDADQVGAVLERSRSAFERWSRVDFAERAGHLRAGKDELAALMAREMGKPVREGSGEAEKCAWVCEYYAENGGRFLADEPAQTEARKSYVTFRPLGVVLAVMPWNIPLWQVFRFAAPALMAGNTVLLKHASSVPGCALAVEELFRSAGLPDGVFRTLLVGSGAVADVIRDARVAAVIPVKDEARAVSVANDTSFGLGAVVYTRDLRRGERIAAVGLEAGCCFVNSFVRSDPRLPFGGVKESGYGRELSSFGIREFVNVKTVYVN